MARLTVETAATIPPEKTRKEHADARCPGLYLQVTPTGARSWVVRYRHGGRPRKLTLGSFDAKTFGLLEARDLARLELSKVDAGRDPAAEKAEFAAVMPKAETGAPKMTGDSPFADVWKLFDDYMAEGVKPGTRSKWSGIYRRVIKPRWDARPLNRIMAEDIDALVYSLHRTPDAADSLRVLCRVFFDWAANKARGRNGERLKLLAESPAVAVPKLERKKGEKPDNERTLSAADIRALWAATASGATVQFGNMVRLLLLTGARRNEVAQAVWSEFDLAAGVWTIPAERNKSDRNHVVYLNPEALEVLNAIPRLDGVDFLFPSEKGETPISGFSKHKARLDKAMGAVDPWKLHDLRRTFATGLARLGVSQTVTARCLNHSSETKQTVLDRIYNVHDFGPEQMEAWQRWGAHVAAVVKADASNIVPLVPEQVESIPA